MHDNVSTPRPRPPCSVTWCQNDHQATPGTHWRSIADMGLERATIELRYVLDEQPESAPFVQVRYGVDWAPLDLLAIPLPAAAALADILGLLTIPTVGEFAAALARGSRGPHSSSTIRW